MLKKVILCALCVMVTLNFAGCNEDGSDNSSANSSVETDTSEISVSSEVNSQDTSEELIDESDNNDTFVDRGGTNLYIPEGFTEEFAYGYTLYSKAVGNDTIYFGFHNRNLYSADTDADSYALEDVPDIEAQRFNDTVYEVMKHYESRTVLTLDSETTETINDLSFIKQKGTMHIEYKEPEDTHDLKYTSLYTLYDNNYYTKIPTSIFLFSDCYDEGTEAELERLAEEIATKTVWVINY